MEKTPRRTSEPDQPKQCRYFLRGRCKFKNNCKFQHGLEEDMSGDRRRTWTNHRSSRKLIDNQYHRRNSQNDHRLTEFRSGVYLRKMNIHAAIESAGILQLNCRTHMHKIETTQQ